MLHTRRQIVRFYGGPADGLERLLFIPDNLPYILLPHYPGACYARPDEKGVSAYLGPTA